MSIVVTVLPVQLRESTVVTHRASATLQPGARGIATAGCAPGELLLSGGFGVTALRVLDNYPSAVRGQPPLTGEAPTTWSAVAINPTKLPETIEVTALCLTQPQ